MEGKLSADRILILTLSFGAGHVRAAEALAAEFARSKANAEVRIIDALEECRFLFRAFYVRTYWLMIRYAPRVWGRFFTARARRLSRQTAPVWAWRWGCPQVFSEIAAFTPSIIVCCEVGASELAVIAKRQKITSAAIVNVITDFEGEPVWVNPEVQLFTVPHQSVLHQLRGWGAAAGTVQICGIPIASSFNVKSEKDDIRERFGFGPKPLVMMMGGGMGPTQMDTVAAKLFKDSDNLQVVAVPGHDARARRALERLAKDIGPNLRVLGWMNDVAALMQAADLLVTKPGGVTLAEAAACGIPLVLFDPIPGPEETNASHFVRAGAAVLARGSVEAAADVVRLLNDEPTRRRMSECAAMIARPTATKDIVQLAIDLAATSIARRKRRVQASA